jgi:hypothetical protein
MNRKAKKDRKITRNMVARSMIIAACDTSMRDRRNRRPKDARRKREDYGTD